MQIDLYNTGEGILREKKQLVGYLVRRQIEIVDVIDEYMTFTADDIYTQQHIKDVISNIDKGRRYTSIFGKASDSHFEIEKLGICKGCKKYTTILSLEDSLDLILHNLCDCDYNLLFDNIKDYQRFSRGILSVNYDIMGNLTLDNLFGIDKKLDDYLINLNMNSKDSYNFLEKFYNLILDNAGELAECLAVLVKKNLAERGIKIVYRSKGYCSFVFTSDVPINEDLIINGKYGIRLNSYLAKEYTKHASRMVRIVDNCR